MDSVEDRKTLSHLLKSLVDNTNTKELSDYLSFLETSSSGEATNHDSQGRQTATPRIDHVLENRRKKDVMTTASQDLSTEGYGPRLEILEHQLADLLKKSRENQASRKLSSPKTPESTTTPESVTKASVQKSKTVNPRSTRSALKKARSTARTPLNKAKLASTLPHSSDSDGESAMNTWSGATTSSLSGPDRHIRPLSKDLQLRDELSETRPNPATGSTNELQGMLKDLEAERERRWKAEQVAQKLVDHVRDLQDRESDTAKRHEGLVIKAADLEQQYRKIWKERDQFSSENEALKKALRELKRALTASKQVVDKQQNALQSLEMSLKKQESEFLEEKMNEKRLLRESESQAAAAGREADLLKKTVRTLKGQLTQLQELLASREQQHKREMEGRVPLQGQELQEVIRKEVHKERHQMSGALHRCKERLAEQETRYRSLEEEFRTALRIEAGRYRELFQAHTTLKEEIDASRQTAVAAVEKERKVSQMMASLSAMVKEQKHRITELRKARDNSDQQLKAKFSKLEIELGVKSKLESKLEFTEEENTKLKSQLLAQTSVVEGLREERQLWGKELAHQGAALAQDRGRMASQIDALTEEVKQLKEKLKDEENCRKIKEKIVADQNDTISKLKYELASRGESFQVELDRCQQEKSLVHDQLEEMSVENRELQSEVAGLHLRKEELKESLAGVEHDLEVSRDKYRKLKLNLEERVRSISVLEEDMNKVKSTFEGKEQTLVSEKAELENQLKVVQERFKACDNNFRHQLSLKERAFQDMLQESLLKKDEELASERSKVAKVEAEMRDLLNEVSVEKRAMKEKMTKLSQVLGDLQLSEARTLDHI